MPLRILITIPQYTPDARATLEGLGEVVEVVPSQTDLAAMVAPCDIVIAGLGLHFDGTVLACASRLRLLATATTGLDHIDLATAAARGIDVVSLCGATEFLRTVTGTAELAWGLLLAFVRQVPAALASVQQRAWERERFRGHELKGATLGIVGLGRLGAMMAKYGSAFGMRVLAADPHRTDAEAAAVGARLVPLAPLLAESDAVSLHVHAAPDTERMIGRAELGMMRPSAVLVNTARGSIVDEAALLDALASGRLAGYAADVLTGEEDFGSAPVAHPLVAYAAEHANVILTPHIGGMTHESRAATDRFIAAQVCVWVRQRAAAAASTER